MQLSTPKQASGPGLCCAMRSWLVAPLPMLAASALMSAPAVGQEVGYQLRKLAALKLALCAWTSLMLSPGAVSAQDLEEVAMPKPACRILESREAEPGNALLAACGKRGINLGPVDRYRVFPDLADDFLLVELERAGRVRVYLLVVARNGAVVVENLTGSLARLAGRSATPSIDNLELEYSQFAESGRITIAQENRAGERGQATVRELNVSFDVRAAASSARSAKERVGPAQPALGEERQ